jgi:hypothetical protein
MNTKKYLNGGLLSAILCLSVPAWVAADTQMAGSNDKTGATANPTYDSGGSNNTTTTADKSKETTTVPSGKRHRTHKKTGTQAQSADANKTIKSGDVTPSN